MTLAETHNNPGCLKQVPGNWKGSTSGLRGHAKFIDVEHGVRALTRQVSSTQRALGGYFTVHDFFKRYAPNTDTIGSLPGASPNDPRGYADFVAKRLDIRINENIHLFIPDGHVVNYDQLIRFLRAIERVEAGKHFVTEAEWLGGIAMYMHDFPESGKGWG